MKQEPISGTEFRGFTALQYYLAHARNSVHAVFDLPRPIAPSEFEDLVQTVVRAAPQVLWRESLADGGHYCQAPADWSDLVSVERFGSLSEADGALGARLSRPLTEGEGPAFEAVCQTIAGPDGAAPTSRLIFRTSHALLEGGDVAGILRGRGAQHDTRPVVDSGLSGLSRLGALALVPLLWPLHMLAARAEKRQASGFGFARLALDRRQVKAAAQRLGVSQRALIFALTTYGIGAGAGDEDGGGGGRRLSTVYSTLPRQRARLSDDEYLNVRIDELRLKPEPDLQAHVQSVAAALERRGRDPMFVQTWQRHLTRLHQRLHSRVPGLYPKSFFGFAPYDLVLSMLPPLRPQAFSPALDGATVFAGSNTGTAPSCIFASAGDLLTLTMWADDRRRDGQIAAIGQAAQALGIAVRGDPGAATGA